MLDDSLIDTLPDDPIDALNIICNEFNHIRTSAETEDESNNLYYARFYEDFVQCFALAEAILENSEFEISHREFANDVQDNMVVIREYFDQIYNLTRIEKGKKQYESDVLRFGAIRGSLFYYEFSQNEIDRIQSLLNELRDLITKSKKFEADHKSRLLNRLERLQSELHKKVSDLDRFWGLVGDAGVVFGKLGEDAKPIVDRIREIASIVWNAQSRAEVLPDKSEFPLLKNKDS